MIPLAFAKPALGFIGSHWKWFLIAGLVIYIGLLKLSLAEERLRGVKLSKALGEQVAAFDRFRSDVVAKTAKAQADDAAHAARVERDQTQVQTETNDAIRNRIAAARAHAGRVRGESCQADPGGRGGPAVPGAANAASGAAGESHAAELPASDRMICAEAVVKAEGWIEWWRAVQAVPR